MKLWRAQLSDARAGARKKSELILPHTMGVGIMKHREYNREGHTCYLHVNYGKVRELEHSEAAARGLIGERY
jgi:hypothetical protein